MIPRRTAQLGLSLTLAVLFASCGQPFGSPTAAVFRPDRVVEVPVSATDTVEALQARYGGRVTAFDPRAGYAILGFDAATPERLGARSLLGPIENNIDRLNASGPVTLWAGGAVTLWAGGAVTLWAGGAVTLWAGGQYAPFPANTAAFRQIELDDAHLRAPNLGAGVKVAVIDTGVDLAHPGLQGALAPAGEWKDFVDGDTTPQDEGLLGVGAAGHGTAVAGLVLQVAPRATILPIRVLAVDGAGDALSVAQAIDHAVGQGAQVINLSLGSDARVSLVRSAVERATAAGVYVVSSAGNDNRNGLTYPAADANLAGLSGDYSLSVGSVNGQHLKSLFSNYGRTLEVVAPGEFVHSFAPQGRVTAWSGTSMSAPLVAGGLALALGQTLDVNRRDVTRKLAESAFDVYNNGLNAGYKDMLGKKGRLDLKQFLEDVLN